jgi:hypothetical protein
METRFIVRKQGCRTSAAIVTIRPPHDSPLTFYREKPAMKKIDTFAAERGGW